MDSINVVNLKIEKANAIKRFNRLRRIATLFRVIEILFMFIVISRFSFQIPVKFSLSGEYLRRIYSAVFGPRFVFVIGNAIVVTLFLKSGWNLNSGLGLGPGPNQFSADVYTEYVENRVKQGNSYGKPGPSPSPSPNLNLNPNRCFTEFHTENIGNRMNQANSNLGSDSGPGPNPNPNRSSAVIHTEYVENRMKQGNLNPNPNPNPGQFWADYETEYGENRVKQGIKERKMNRSNSEDLRRDVPRRQMQRSETEVGRVSSVEAEEEISGVEFRRRVEAFIARQQRSLREEEFS